MAQGGTITWRVQLGGADQARAEFRSLGDAGAQAAATTAGAWDGAADDTSRATAQVRVLADAWRAAEAERRGYASDLRSSGLQQGPTALQQQQAASAAAAQQAQARINASTGVGAGAGRSAAASASVFEGALAEQAREASAQRVAQETALAAAAQAAQSRINASLGVGAGQAGSAAASGAVFAEELTAMEKLESRANTLKSALDPLYAAQQKYGSAVREAGELVAAGVISEGEHAAAVGVAKTALHEAEEAALNTGRGYHLTSIQAMELEHSARAMTDAIMAGGNPMRVLAMEVGRFGQVMGEGQGGVAGALTALRSIVLGPIGAVGALAAAFLAAATAEQSYAASQSQLERYIMGAGREAGVTAAQLEALTQKAAAAGDVSVAAARGMAVEFLKTGQIAAEVFPGLIAMSRNFAAATGVDAKQATQELAKAFADPARGAEELNKSLHFLDDQQLEHIRLLAESGERTQAQEEMTQRLTAAIGPAADHLTDLGKTLHEVAKAFSDCWTESGKFFYNLTHVPSAADGVAAIQARMKTVQTQIDATQYSEGGQVAVGNLKAQLADLQKSLAEAQSKVAHPGLTAAQNEVSTRAGNVARANDPTLAERERLQGELVEVKAAADQNFAGMSKEVADAARRQLAALPRQIATLMTPQQREVKEADLRAQLAARPGSARRGDLQEQLAALRTAGQNLTPEEAAAIQSSGRLQGENRGARVDNAAAKRAEADANKANTADKESSDAVLRAQETASKAEETIAAAKGQEARTALEAIAADAGLNAGERRSRMAQAAAELGIQNAKDTRLKLELQRIEQDRTRQLADVGHQTGWTDAQRAAASRAIGAASDAQARAARASDAARLNEANGAAGRLGSEFQVAALKSRTSDETLPAADRAKAEQTLLQLQEAEARVRLLTITSAAGVQSATADRARQALADSQGAELKLHYDTQLRELTIGAMEAAKRLATTQGARNDIERGQLAIAQQQRAAATQILLAQLDEAVLSGRLSQAKRDALAAQLTRARGNLDGSEQEALRRQQLTPLGKLADPSSRPSLHDAAEADAAAGSERLSSAFVQLEENTTTFSKALKDVIGSIQGTVLKQLTDRALAPVDRLIDQGLDKLLPAAADTGTATANAAMAQSAAATTLAINSLGAAAAAAATRLGVSGVAADGTPGFSLFGSSGSFGGLTASGASTADIAGLYAGGGLIRGRGTGTSDSNLARVSHGEYIVNAAATAQHYDLIDHINSGAGSLPHFAGGGYFGDDRDRRHRAFMAVGGSQGLPDRTAGGDVHLHNNTGKPMKASSSRGPNGDILVALTPMFERAARGRASDPNGLGRDIRMIPQILKKRS